MRQNTNIKDKKGNYIRIGDKVLYSGFIFHVIKNEKMKPVLMSGKNDHFIDLYECDCEVIGRG